MCYHHHRHADDPKDGPCLRLSRAGRPQRHQILDWRIPRLPVVPLRYPLIPANVRNHPIALLIILRHVTSALQGFQIGGFQVPDLHPCGSVHTSILFYYLDAKFSWLSSAFQPHDVVVQIIFRVPWWVIDWDTVFRLGHSITFTFT